MLPESIALPFDRFAPGNVLLVLLSVLRSLHISLEAPGPGKELAGGMAVSSTTATNTVMSSTFPPCASAVCACRSWKNWQDQLHGCSTVKSCHCLQQHENCHCFAISSYHVHKFAPLVFSSSSMASWADFAVMSMRVWKSRV